MQAGLSTALDMNMALDDKCRQQTVRNTAAACMFCLETVVEHSRSLDKHGTPVKGDAEAAPALALMLVPTDANSDATTAMAAKLMLDIPTAPARPSPSAHAATPKASASAMLSTVGEAAMAVVETLSRTVCTAASALLAPFTMSPAKHELSTAVIHHLLHE